MRHHEEEMESGVLPVFAAAAVFGAAVGGLIVALMLYSSALERRDDYATLKALGAGQRYLLRLVVGQALLVTLARCAAAVVFTAALTPLLLRAVPALALRYLPWLLLVFPRPSRSARSPRPRPCACCAASTLARSFRLRRIAAQTLM